MSGKGLRRSQAPIKLHGGDEGEVIGASMVSSVGGVKSRGSGLLCDTLWVELYVGGTKLWCSNGGSAAMDRLKHEC